MINGSDYILPPMAGNVANLALAAASQAFVIPAGWRQSFVTLTAEGADAWVLFGAAGVIVDRSAVAGATQGVFIPQGASLTALVTTQAEIAYQSTAAAGYLRVWRSSTTGGNQ